MSLEERDEHRRKKVEQKAERDKTAKMMDLQYFLEMVDQKHRYGSNLRAYHDQWKKSNTKENFFYWLDQGEGRDFEHPTVSRERLEKEQVKYLTREERMKYLVKIDKEGRLCWAKNGERINTTTEYKDSVDGIVPKDDSTPAYASSGKLKDGESRTSTSSSSAESLDSDEHSDVEGEHYVNHDLRRAKGISKLKYVSAATILNHLLRGSVKPNSWIFVGSLSTIIAQLTRVIGGRHIVPPLCWHQAIWCIPAQLISPRCQDLGGRADEDQRWPAPSPIPAVRPLPAAHKELPSLRPLPAG